MRKSADDCVRFAPLLDAYLDGELNKTTARRLEAHLAACPACAAELEECRRLRELLAACDAETIPTQGELDALHESVMASVRQQPRATVPAPSARKNLCHWATGIAAAFVLLAVLLPVALYGSLLQKATAPSDPSADAPSMNAPEDGGTNNGGVIDGAGDVGDSANDSDPSAPDYRPGYGIGDSGIDALGLILGAGVVVVLAGALCLWAILRRRRAPRSRQTPVRLKQPKPAPASDAGRRPWRRWAVAMATCAALVMILIPVVLFGDRLLGENQAPGASAPGLNGGEADESAPPSLGPGNPNDAVNGGDNTGGNTGGSAGESAGAPGNSDNGEPGVSVYILQRQGTEITGETIIDRVCGEWSEGDVALIVNSDHTATLYLDGQMLEGEVYMNRMECFLELSDGRLWFVGLEPEEKEGVLWLIQIS